MHLTDLVLSKKQCARVPSFEEWRRISVDIINTYHSGIDIYWQGNVCRNTDFSLEGIQKTPAAGFFLREWKNLFSFATTSLHKSVAKYSKL